MRVNKKKIFECERNHVLGIASMYFTLVKNPIGTLVYLLHVFFTPLLYLYEGTLKYNNHREKSLFTT